MFIEHLQIFLVVLIIVALSAFGRHQQRIPSRSIVNLFFELLVFFTAPGRRMVFLKSIFAVLAKLARADGTASDVEIESVEKAAYTLKLTQKEYAVMVKHFNDVLDNDSKTLNDYLKPFMKAFSDDMTSRLLFIRVLFSLAASDKYFHPSEEFILKNVAATLKISPTQYNVMRGEFFPHDTGWRAEQRSRTKPQDFDWHKEQSRHRSDLHRNPHRKYYDILGLSPDCSDDELKKAHRELALENHPDRLLTRGFPPQALHLLNERFLQIQNAYEQIRNMRGMK